MTSAPIRIEVGDIACALFVDINNLNNQIRVRDSEKDLEVPIILATKTNKVLKAILQSEFTPFELPTCDVAMSISTWTLIGFSFEETSNFAKVAQTSLNSKTAAPNSPSANKHPPSPRHRREQASAPFEVMTAMVDFTISLWLGLYPCKQRILT
ncbi:hypothetical protein ACHAQK_009881 [Fusarium lateritium]